ncbi:MAG: hypothetical protein Q9227_003318 [Pyrenula ochraceoflavens]
MFVGRVELLSEGDTVQEHEEAKRIEAEGIEKDRNGPHGAAGLFKGAFPFRHPIPSTIHDHEDGVDRCPVCTWELVDGSCPQCGFGSDGDDSHSYSGDSSVESERYGMHGDVDVEVDYDDFEQQSVNDYQAAAMEAMPHQTFPGHFNSAWDEDLDPEEMGNYDSADDTSTVTGAHGSGSMNYSHQSGHHYPPNPDIEDYTDYDDDTDGDDEETSSLRDFIDRDESVDGGEGEDGDSISSFHRHAIMAGDLPESEQDSENASSMTRSIASDSSRSRDSGSSTESSEPESDQPEPSTMRNDGNDHRNGARRNTRAIVITSSDESDSDTSEANNTDVQEVSPPQTTTARRTRHQAQQEQRNKRGPRRRRRRS